MKSQVSAAFVPPVTCKKLSWTVNGKGLGSGGLSQGSWSVWKEVTSFAWFILLTVSSYSVLVLTMVVAYGFAALVVLIGLPGASSLQAVVFDQLLLSYPHSEERKSHCLLSWCCCSAVKAFQEVTGWALAGWIMVFARLLKGYSPPTRLKSWDWTSFTITAKPDLGHNTAVCGPPEEGCQDKHAASIDQTSGGQWWSNKWNCSVSRSFAVQSRDMVFHVCWQRSVQSDVCISPSPDCPFCPRKAVLLPLLRKVFCYPEMISLLQLAVWILTGFLSMNTAEEDSYFLYCICENSIRRCWLP